MHVYSLYRVRYIFVCAFWMSVKTVGHNRTVAHIPFSVSVTASACVQHDRSIFNIWIVLRLSICGHGAAYWVQFYFCLLITSQRQINSSCLHFTYIQFVGNEKKIQPHIFHWLQNMQTYDKCASKWTKNRSDIFQVKSIFNKKKQQQIIFQW